MTKNEIITILNTELFEKHNVTDLFFIYSTSGFSEVIIFDERIIWSSENDEREFIEEIHEYEDLLFFVKRKFNEYADYLQKIKF